MGSKSKSIKSCYISLCRYMSLSNCCRYLPASWIIMWGRVVTFLYITVEKVWTFFEFFLKITSTQLKILHPIWYTYLPIFIYDWFFLWPMMTGRPPINQLVATKVGGSHINYFFCWYLSIYESQIKIGWLALFINKVGKVKSLGNWAAFMRQ